MMMNCDQMSAQITGHSYTDAQIIRMVDEAPHDAILSPLAIWSGRSAVSSTFT